MTDSDQLARIFEQHRARLRAVALRMLGDTHDADDAVQEAWLRTSRAGTEDVANLGGWLTTVVARICLDTLRSRRSHAEDSLDEAAHDPALLESDDAHPERATLLADAIGPALQVVLDTLAPAERVAFVLHDMFGLSFDEIAPIVDKSAVAARQLASRARRRVRGASPSGRDTARRREVVEAFRAASRDGNLAALLAVLDPDVVVRADAAVIAMGGGMANVRGAEAVARAFLGRAQAARPALVDGAPGLAWAPGGTPRVVFAFTIEGGRVTALELIADPERFKTMDLVIEAS